MKLGISSRPTTTSDPRVVESNMGASYKKRTVNMYDCKHLDT